MSHSLSLMQDEEVKEALSPEVLPLAEAVSLTADSLKFTLFQKVVRTICICARHT